MPVKMMDIARMANQFSYPTTPEEMRKIQEAMAALGYDPGNIYQELEMDSRFVDIHQDTSFSNANVCLHSHAFYEVIYCRSAENVEYLVGADRYRLQKGDIVFVAPGTSHRPLLPEQMTGPYCRDVLWLSEAFVERLRELLPDVGVHGPLRSNLLRTDGTKWEYLGDYFRISVKEAEQQAPGWETVVYGNAMTLMAHLHRAYLDKQLRPMPAERPELLDRAIFYMEAHLAEKLTLALVAKQFYVSESTISQTFRKKMGVSFYRYLTQRRLIAAKTLISEGIPLEIVSQRVGFSDYSTFYRAFRQEYGISPRQYRKIQGKTLVGIAMLKDEEDIK